MLNAGYVWDKNQKWYFKAGVDADGKPQADYSKPASREIYERTIQQAGDVAQGIGGTRRNDADPLGWRTPSSQQQRPVPPKIPQPGDSRESPKAAPSVDWDNLTPEEYAKIRAVQSENAPYKALLRYGKGTGELTPEDYSH